MIASSRSGKGRLLFLLPPCRGRACPARGVKGDCPLKGGRADLRAGRLAAHNERRQPAKLARSCGCLPRGGKHCSLPGFAPLNRGPTLTTPQCPAPTGKLTLPHTARSGQDRSLRTAAHGCFVGRGLDPSGQPVAAARPLRKPPLSKGGGPKGRRDSDGPRRVAHHTRKRPGIPPPRCARHLPLTREAFSIPRQNGARFAAGPVLVGIGK